MSQPANTGKTLSASIVLHNSPLGLLRRNIRSLQRAAQLARDAGSIESLVVYVVDNSPDSRRREVGRQMAADWPQQTYFRLQFREAFENHGFGAGHNSILPDLESNYHLILNPDVELEENALHTGLSLLQQRPDVALLSPWVAGSEGGQEFLCKRYPSVLVLILRAFAPQFLRSIFASRLANYEMRDVCAQESEAEVLLASGCFMLIRTQALRDTGGFDDRYFLYFEDFDLSLRLAVHGRLLFLPSMRIVHHGGYAARKGGKHVKYFLRSGVTFFNQYGWRWI